MKVLELGVAERAVLGRDVELPRQIGRTAEGFIVEEVAPPADRLAEYHVGPHDIEAAQDRELPPVREPHTEQRPHDQAAVHGEPAFPDGDDLPRIPAVVIPVEGDLVEPRTDQTGQDRPLPGADDVVGRKIVSLGLAVAEPESDDDRGGHENAVPADDDRTDLERDRAR